MDIRGWDERYRSEDGSRNPTPLVMETAARLVPGAALDLACGTGRNAIWLAEQGWSVTAVDASPVAIDRLRSLAPAVDTRVADLEKHEYSIAPSSWQLILMCYYLQRDLFEAAKAGVVHGGTIVTIVHMTEGDEEPTRHRLRPGELAAYFDGWEIVHYYEGKPRDTEHQRAVAEIVARRP